MEITIQTHSFTIIRMRGTKEDFGYCQNCQTKVPSFYPPHASLIFGVNELELRQLCQNSHIHFALPEALCGNSLAEYFKREICFVEA